MSTLSLNLIFKRKQTSKGAIAAPYETIRVIGMRKIAERKVVDECFPESASFSMWEWLIICDTEFKIFCDEEFDQLRQHYEVVNG